MLLDTLPANIRHELTSWQRGYIVGTRIPADKAIEKHRASIRKHYAPLLTRFGPHIRLYRGEEADDTKIHRVFLSWTDHYGEAEGFGGESGVVRIADVPTSRIIAVLPHGQGVEFLVTAGPIRGEKRVEPTHGAYIEVDPQDDRAYFERGRNLWVPGTKEKARVHAAISRMGGQNLRWRVRRDSDQDYWSGYPPVPDHGAWHFRASAKAITRIEKALGVQAHRWE